MDTGSSAYSPNSGGLKDFLAQDGSFGSPGANHAAMLTIFPRQITHFNLPLDGLAASPFSSRYVTPYHASKAQRGERFAPVLDGFDSTG